MIHESKTATVAFACTSYDNDLRIPAAKDAIRHMETNGWRGRWQDLFNDHKRVSGTGCFHVTFDRWVARSGEDRS